MGDIDRLLGKSLPRVLTRLHASQRLSTPDFDDLDELRRRMIAARRKSKHESIALVEEFDERLRRHPTLVGAEVRPLAAVLAKLRHELSVVPAKAARRQTAQHGEALGHLPRNIGSSGADLFVDGLDISETRVPTRSHALHGSSTPDARGGDKRETQTSVTPAAEKAQQHEAQTTPHVYWNTRVMDGDKALEALHLRISQLYKLETGLMANPQDDALTTTDLAADIPDGTPVAFTVSSLQPVLIANSASHPARPSVAPTTQVTWKGRYDAHNRCCGPASVGLVPMRPGRLVVEVSLSIGNGLQCSHSYRFSVSEPAAAPAIEANPVPAGAIVPFITPDVSLHLNVTNQDAGLLLSAGMVEDDDPGRTANPWAVLCKQAILARAKLTQLSNRYRRAGPSEFALEDGPALLLEMAQIGAVLHERVFGTPNEPRLDLRTRAIANCIAHSSAAGVLQITSRYHLFPWALFYDGEYRGRPLREGDPSSVDLHSFWGVRFVIQRGIVGRVFPPPSPILTRPIRTFACVSRNAANEPGTGVFERQEVLFRDIPGVTDLRKTHASTASDWLNFLQSERACEIIYLLCHATAARSKEEDQTPSAELPDDGATLAFPPDKPITVAEMRKVLNGAIPARGANSRPLVFLNACSSVAGDHEFQSPMLELFLYTLNALGVIGTDCLVPTEFADVFSQRVFHYFLKERRNIGDALRLASQEAFEQGNPFPLIYALYAPYKLIVGGGHA